MGSEELTTQLKENKEKSDATKMILKQEIYVNYELRRNKQCFIQKEYKIDCLLIQ